MTIHRHIKVEKQEFGVRRLPGTYWENILLFRMSCLAERACREGDRDTHFMRQPCSPKYLVKPCWGVKELFPLLTLDKGAEVPRSHHTRCVAAVPSRYRCASLGRL